MMLLLRYKSSPLIALLNEKKIQVSSDFSSRMLRIPKRRLQQVINRFFIPASHPEIKHKSPPAYKGDYAHKVPAIDFGQLCLEPLEKSKKPVNVGRNENIVALWVRLLQFFTVIKAKIDTLEKQLNNPKRSQSRKMLLAW